MTVCYSDVECRGNQICNVYYCVDAPDAEPGCCYGDSYKANEKCSKATEQEKCESKGCEWMVTDDAADCELTTTESPTTTEEIGCCKGDSFKSNAKCNMKLTSDKCDRSSSCHWIARGVLEDDCAFGTTEVPEEPGCCYGNPDAAYSKRWMETCTGYFTERECVMLTNDDAVARCVWAPRNDQYDCSQLWPTTETPTEPAGCCYGDSYKANDKCSKAKDQSKCVKNGCSWLVTDDADDCAMTTTKTSEGDVGCCDSDIAKKFKICEVKDSRVQCEHASSCYWRSGDDAVCDAPEDSDEKAGCCYGDSYKSNTKCLKATDEKKCEKNGCSWRITDDPDDCELTTTQSELTEQGCCAGTSAKNAEVCNAKFGRESCERSVKCEFREGKDADCSGPWLGAYDLSVNSYKRSSKQRRTADRKQESVLSDYGEEGFVADSMHSTVSLSTLMLFVVATFAAFQLFKWWSARTANGYAKLADAAPTARTNSFQTV